MLVLCYGAKGGVGTTTVAASVALCAERLSLLVDLAGDGPRAVGVDSGERPGVAEWFASDAPATSLAHLEIGVGSRSSSIGRSVIGWSSAPSPSDRRDRTESAAPSTADHLADPARWGELVRWLEAESAERLVVVDAGSGATAADRIDRLGDCVARRVLVVRHCYLALVAAQRLPRPTAAVAICDPARPLNRDDVSVAVGAAVIPCDFDPAVGRLVDVGIAVGRLPRGWRRSIVGLLDELDAAPSSPVPARPDAGDSTTDDDAAEAGASVTVADVGDAAWAVAR